jgi:hypothetical protein
VPLNEGRKGCLVTAAHEPVEQLVIAEADNRAGFE